MDRYLDDVLAELTVQRRLRKGGRGLRFTRRYGAWVLQIESDDRVRSTWLEAYRSQHRGILPVNRNPQPPRQGGGSESVTELAQVAEALKAITHGIGYGGRPPYRLPLVFPRFVTAYTALCVWSPAQGQVTDDSQIDGLAEAIEAAIKEERKHVLRELRSRLRDAPADGAPAPVNWLLVAGRWLAGALSFPHRRTIRWYRTQRFRTPTQHLHTSRDVYEELLTWRKNPPEPGDAKVNLMVDALLADIAAHYGVFRRLNRVCRPLIVLPDVQESPVRRRIRKAFLSAYRGPFRRLRAYPVVVTTSRPEVDPAVELVRSNQLARKIPDALRTWEAELEFAAGNRQLPPRLTRVAPDLGAPSASMPFSRRTGRVGPVTLALCLVLVCTLGLGTWRALRDDRPQQAERKGCGAGGLELYGRDCIGVSDGTGVFMPDVKGMREVSSRIAAENGRIAHQKYATVALMIPLESDNPAVQRQILSEVQGAYLAQREANGPDSAKPPVRLVLVNPGRGYGHWGPAVESLVAGERRLRVVTGFNLSLQNTKDALRHVTRDLRLPVVASVVTANDFANPEGPDRGKDPYPGLARVAPTTKDQVRALLGFDPALASEQTALVADTRQKDSYNLSLRETFTEARSSGKNGAAQGVQDMTFHSPGPEEEGITANDFVDFAHNICESNARSIYFAGRAFHLELFIKKLAGTYCAGKKSYTVITGSDATTLSQRLSPDERLQLRGDAAGKPSVSVRYAAPAHPGAWDVEIDRWKKQQAAHGRPEPKKQDRPRYLAEPQDAMRQLRADIAAAGNIGPVDLDDGRTIITHDVVLTAEKALAKAATIARNELPPAAQVAQDFAHLNLASRVAGASGWVCLTNAGNPYDKASFVVRLDPARDTLRFEGVAWPTGDVPPRNCAVPQQPAG